MTGTRREFMRDGTTLLAGVALLSGAPSFSVASGAGASWPIGCLNRPWTKWSLGEALAAIQAAGYSTMGLLTPTRADRFIAADATAEYLEGLKSTLAASGLTAIMGSLRSRFEGPLEETVKGLEKQIENAAFLGLKTVMTFGVDDPAQSDHHLRSMAHAAAYAAERGIQVVMKPHGGSSGAADEIVAAIKKVSHPNFRIWYDAGNIIYYTGKDPVDELRPIAEYVTGFCAKDCGAVRGDVMIQFGTGKVDFAGVFRVLKAAGFSGPVMVECCAVGETPEATGANARANREFLERVMTGL